MTCSAFSKFCVILICLIASCSPKEIQPIEDSKTITPSLDQFAVIDLDRCKSCFQNYGDKLSEHSNDSTFLVFLLSTSRKKAEIFGRDSKVNYRWDSARYFEHYLEKEPIFIQRKEGQ